MVIWPLWRGHSPFSQLPGRCLVSARPLVFVPTLTLLQKTGKWVFWHPSEAMYDHAFAQLSGFHCSAKRSEWSCRGGQALECIWPLKQRFIQGCASVRSCFPKVNRTTENYLKSVLGNCSFLSVVSGYLTPANCVMFTGLNSLSAWDQQLKELSLETNCQCLVEIMCKNVISSRISPSLLTFARPSPVFLPE